MTFISIPRTSPSHDIIHRYKISLISEAIALGISDADISNYVRKKLLESEISSDVSVIILPEETFTYLSLKFGEDNSIE